MGVNFGDLDAACNYSAGLLKHYGTEVDTGRWQGIDTRGKPDLVTREILDLRFETPLLRREWKFASVSDYYHRLAVESGCNEQWAAEHFAERVGGKPMNPDPSYVRWPWWKGQTDDTRSSDISEPFRFTHTYSERFWPKWAGEFPHAPEQGEFDYRTQSNIHKGIRFRYGDYNDVLDLLAEDPYTRQAYLPIFFPEDTGAVHRGRIPCSLGYHFLLRGTKLHCWYEIRSCDAVRHFRDDLYLAACLVGHTIEQLAGRETMPGYQDHHDFTDPLAETFVWRDVDPGTLYFTAHSFHVHMGDYHLL